MGLPAFASKFIQMGDVPRIIAQQGLAIRVLGLPAELVLNLLHADKTILRSRFVQISF